MGIDRHNCEDWFVLYADDELDAAGRRMVEDFLATNPDTAGLLESILHVRLKPDDDIRFEGKQQLLKSEEAPVERLSEADREWMLLMADGEATSEERRRLEDRLAANAALRSEWETLTQIRLRPDPSIVYPDRASLYRRESGYRVMPWLAVSAAASLLIILGLRMWPASSDRPAGTLTTDMTTVEPASDAPAMAETESTGQQTTVKKNSEPASVAVSAPSKTRPETATEAPASIETKWRETVAATTETTTGNESSSKTEDDRKSTSESLAVNEAIEAPTKEDLPSDGVRPSVETRPAAMRDVKTDYATEALIEDWAEPRPRGLKKALLSSSRMKVAARKADRYYQKITNPPFEPRPLEVKWASNRQ